MGVDDQTGYRQLSVRLDKGDKVLCYTDAFTDARGPDGKALGVEGMLQIVASIEHAGRRAAEGQASIAAVCEAVKALHPDNLTQDDATIVLFRANGTQASIRNDLLAPLRFLGGVSDNSRIATAKTA